MFVSSRGARQALLTKRVFPFSVREWNTLTDSFVGRVTYTVFRFAV